MIYIIDHQDSFTWNVVHQFSEFEKVYCSNYFNINKRLLEKSKIIVLSPGPGSPKDYPLTSKIYKKYKGKKKIIGICLGYQQILFNESGRIVQQKNIFHGYQSKVKVTKDSKIFKKKNFISEKIKNLISTLKNDFSIKNPKIALAALNPHAGESNLIGYEESKYIVPELKKLKNEKIFIDGPFAADSLFLKKKLSYPM